MAPSDETMTASTMPCASAIATRLPPLAAMTPMPMKKKRNVPIPSARIAFHRQPRISSLTLRRPSTLLDRFPAVDCRRGSGHNDRRRRGPVPALDSPTWSEGRPLLRMTRRSAQAVKGDTGPPLAPRPALLQLRDGRALGYDDVGARDGV